MNTGKGKQQSALTTETRIITVSIFIKHMTILTQRPREEKIFNSLSHLYYSPRGKINNLRNKLAS